MEKDNLSGYLFILPIILLFSLFIIYPVAFNLIISFFDWNGISIKKNFIGLGNYISLLHNPVMNKIIFNYVIFAAITLVGQAIVGLFLASLLRKKLRLGEFYRILIYLPVIATPAIVGNIFSRIFETNRGYLNGMLRAVHLDGLCQQWLADPKFALGCIIFVSMWQWTGYSMLMYYANMMNISGDIYEAATIDGANGFQKLVRITIPLLRGTHYTLFILGMIGALKTFDLPYVLTRGGPNHATEFFSTYILTETFDLYKQGEASALVVFMLIIALVISAVQLRFYYRNDKDKELAG